MATKRNYINLIRWSCIIQSFNNYYFLRIIVIYLLAQNVTPWVAVSIPVVFEFATLISRCFNFAAKFALKVNYKKYHIIHLVLFLILGIFISQSRNVYTIYLFTMISGFLTGIKDSCTTKLDTQNKEYEPFCFIEEERSRVIGGSLGLIISQILYDINAKLYIIGYIILIIIGIVISFLLKNIPSEDVMEPINNEPIEKKEKNNTILVSSLFGIIAGLWCMGWSGFNEIAPLISSKIGYLESVYTILEIFLLVIISGKIIKRIKDKKKLLLVETIIACIDLLCVLFVSITLSWQGLLLAYIITAFTATLADPIWGSIMSCYSTNNRTKWVLVNKIYFITRSIFTVISWFVCRQCVISGLDTLKYLSIVLIILTAIFYLIANKVNKKVFGDSI